MNPPSLPGSAYGRFPVVQYAGQYPQGTPHGESVPLPQRSEDGSESESTSSPEHGNHVPGEKTMNVYFTPTRADAHRTQKAGAPQAAGSTRLHPFWEDPQYWNNFGPTLSQPTAPTLNPLQFRPPYSNDTEALGLQPRTHQDHANMQPPQSCVDEKQTQEQHQNTRHGSWDTPKLKTAFEETARTENGEEEMIATSTRASEEETHGVEAALQNLVNKTRRVFLVDTTDEDPSDESPTPPRLPHDPGPKRPTGGSSGPALLDPFEGVEEADHSDQSSVTIREPSRRPNSKQFSRQAQSERPNGAHHRRPPSPFAPLSRHGSLSRLPRRVVHTDSKFESSQGSIRSPRTKQKGRRDSLRSSFRDDPEATMSGSHQRQVSSSRHHFTKNFRSPSQLQPPTTRCLEGSNLMSSNATKSDRTERRSNLRVPGAQALQLKDRILRGVRLVKPGEATAAASAFSGLIDQPLAQLSSVTRDRLANSPSREVGISSRLSITPAQPRLPTRYEDSKGKTGMESVSKQVSAPRNTEGRPSGQRPKQDSEEAKKSNTDVQASKKTTMRYEEDRVSTLSASGAIFIKSTDGEAPLAANSETKMLPPAPQIKPERPRPDAPQKQMQPRNYHIGKDSCQQHTERRVSFSDIDEVKFFTPISSLTSSGGGTVHTVTDSQRSPNLERSAPPTESTWPPTLNPSQWKDHKPSERGSDNSTLAQNNEPLTSRFSEELQPPERTKNRTKGWKTHWDQSRDY